MSDLKDALRLWPQAVRTGNVITWDSNGRHPFPDMLESWQELGLIDAETVAATKAAREVSVETMREYAEMQAARTPEQLAEERAEMRAAFGPGEVVVNVITGERTQL